MEIELQGIPQSIKPQYQVRIKSAKADLTRFKKLSKDLHAQLTRSDLLGAGGRPIGPSSADDPYGTSDRTRLLAGTALLEDGTKRLQESQRIALETEEQGADILSNLRRQREQIENSRDMVRWCSPPVAIWWADDGSRSYTEQMCRSIGPRERSRR
jgi:vesicle transport through interaction with t-SNAREs protein 1